MDAIVTAGRSPEEKDPLYSLTHGRLKALMPLDGRPMVTYVLEALAGMREPGRTLLYGIDDDLPLAPVPANVQRFPGQGGILQNVEHGLEQLRHAGSGSPYVVVCTGDLPLLRADLLDEHLAECMRSDHDFYFTMIPMAAMEARFPGAKRSFLHFKEGPFAGGNVHVLRRDFTGAERELLHRMILARKSAIRQVALAGPRAVLQVLTHRMTIPEGERIFTHRFHLRARVIVSRHAELGMDVDAPSEARVAERELAARRAAARDVRVG